MWAIIAPYIVKTAISLAITLLQKSGVLNRFEADGVRFGTHVIQATKVEDTYPEEVHRNGV